ncbi:MAG: M42 family metallopeptidase [Clostridiaceae bacterium]|nr:M42 family metallopeptidase [Clostridiaceae bacterium]
MELLKKLCLANGTSGEEENIRDIIIEEVKDYVDEYKTDPLGNLICVKKGTGGGKKIMYAAHMDEIGVIVTVIDDKGFLRFSNIGGINPYNMVHRKVRFKNGTVGVVSFDADTKMGELNLSKMFIDIGAKSKEEAEKYVQIGDSASLVSEFVDLNNHVSCKAMDDRAGCYCLIEAVKKNLRTENDIYYVFTTQEELGLRGATTAGFNVDPDFAIAIDVTRTGDIPEAKRMAVMMDNGVCIKIKDDGIISHPYVVNYMKECAKKDNIKYQLEVLEGGRTDSGAIHLTRSGVKAGVISIPSRYIHSPSETVSKKDLEECIKLIVATEKYQFKEAF